jgi:hypothetical protein
MSDIAQCKESGGSNSDFQTTSHSKRFAQNELSDLIRDLKSFEGVFRIGCLQAKGKECTLSWNEDYILTKKRKGFAAILYRRLQLSILK